MRRKLNYSIVRQYLRTRCDEINELEVVVSKEIRYL